MSDRLSLFELTNAIRANTNRLRSDLVDGIAKAYDLGYAEGFAKGFAEGGIAASEQVKEQVAQWMIARSYATGHGDTIGDLLIELEGQARGRWESDTRFLTLDDLRKADEMDRRHEEDME